jgi:hypothetical protein
LEAIAMANYLLLAIFHPQKTAFAMAPTVIATARCKITTAVATVILSDIVHSLSNNNSTVNSRTVATARNGAVGSHCNG